MKTTPRNPETRPHHFYMPRDTGEPDPENPGSNIIVYDIEAQVETGYPAGTAVITRKSEKGYQRIQASPDTIAVSEGEELHLMQYVFQTWVHLELWTTHWSRPQPTNKDNNWDEPSGRVVYTAVFGADRWLQTDIVYNWFREKVNQYFYTAQWLGEYIRIHTETQVYRPDQFIMNLDVIQVPYNYEYSGGLHRITYFPDGVLDYLTTEV